MNSAPESTPSTAGSSAIPNVLRVSSDHKRNGKIARLPKAVRDKINQWIDDGRTYPQIIKDLGDAKDAIGEWHDWTELEAIVVKVLHHSGGCNVLREIHSTVQKKLDHALSVAVRLRRKYFRATGKRGRHASQSLAPRRPVVMTTTKLAA